MTKLCFVASVVVGSGDVIFLRRWRRVLRLAVVLDVRGRRWRMVILGCMLDPKSRDL